MEKELEELKKKSEAIDMILNIMAESGDPRFIFVKKEKDLQNKMHKISMNNNIPDDKFKKMNNLLDQFEKMLNDIEEESYVEKL